MKEIKFRAWNNIDKGFIAWSSIKFILSSILASRHYSLMQYTGLKDMNGVEIYEGDIAYIAGVGNCVVRWRDWYLGFMFCRESEDHELFSVIEDVEKVIGNIHENPELIE